MKQKLLLVLFFCFAMVATTFAQSKTVKGKVTDSETGEGVPGVNVIIKGTTKGTVTNVDGDYELTGVPNGAVLEFRAVGMKTVEQAVGTQSMINLAMDKDTKELGEVVVTGYRTYDKEKSNVSSVTVTAEGIKSRPNPSVVQTLSGQVPGLSITTNSGQPGANSTVNLRGVGSINGDTEPLFIIDGAPVDQDNFRSLNPNEIASITVLKDAGATAIYGNRGANGVIVIETKRAGYDTPLQVTYTAQYISNTLQANDYNLMSSPQQLRLEREYGNGRGTTLTDAQINATPTFDWADYFFSQGVGINHNLQFSKGGARSQSYFSIGYLDQEGILQTSSLERFNLRTNVSGRSENNKFNYSLNVSVNYSENEEPNAIGTGGINQNYVLGAYQSVPYITDADYVDGRSLLSPLVFVNTPLFLIDRLKTHFRDISEVRGLGTLSLGYEIIKGLNVNARFSADYIATNSLFAQSPESFNALLFAETGNNTAGFQDRTFNQQFTFNQLTSISYSKTFGKHSFTVGAFTEYFKADLTNFGFRAEGQDPSTFFPGDGSGYVPDNAANDFFVDAAFANLAESGLFSYFGQASYDFDSKYGLELTLRRDASSRFARSNRWATFYAVSGRWNIHNERFAENLPFDVLKLRGSYGTNGNQNITGGGSYFAGLDLTRSLFATGSGYGGANSLFLSQIGNTTLRWETVAQANIAVDMAMLDNKLRATFEGYIKTTTDLYQSQPVSAVNSTTSLAANIGKLENRGFDFQIAYDVIRPETKDGLLVTVNVLGNYNKQEILDLPGDETELIGTGRIGGPLFEYYSVRYAGVNPANGNLLFYTADGEVTENPNVDTDRVWLGKNIFPDWQGSFGLNIDYKGFFVTAQFNYTVGVDRFDFDLSGFQNPTNIGQFRSSTDLLRAWTPDNRVTDIPALRANNIDLNSTGTRYLTDASFLRLRFFTFGYNIPQEWLQKVKLRTGSIFFNGENLVTFSKWRGFDPEALSNTSRLYPTPRTWTIGIEIGI